MQAAAAGISTVYQEVNLCANLSVAENIFIGREPRRFGAVRWGEMRRRARALLGRLDLDIDVTAMLGTYSARGAADGRDRPGHRHRAAGADPRRADVQPGRR